MGQLYPHKQHDLCRINFVVNTNLIRAIYGVSMHNNGDINHHIYAVNSPPPYIYIYESTKIGIELIYMLL